MLGFRKYGLIHFTTGLAILFTKLGSQLQCPKNASSILIQHRLKTGSKIVCSPVFCPNCLPLESQQKFSLFNFSRRTFPSVPGGIDSSGQLISRQLELCSSSKLISSVTISNPIILVLPFHVQRWPRSTISVKLIHRQRKCVSYITHEADDDPTLI